MAAENVKKNEESPKSRMSRTNFLLVFLLHPISLLAQTPAIVLSIDNHGTGGRIVGIICFMFLNGKIAKSKGYPFWVGAISGIFIFVGTILWLILPNLNKNKHKSPYCDESIAENAKKCKHGGEWLEEGDIEKTLAEDDNKQGTVVTANTDNQSYTDQRIIKRISILDRWNDGMFGLSICLILLYIYSVIAFKYELYAINTCIFGLYCFIATLVSCIKRMKVSDLTVKNGRSEHLTRASNSLNNAIFIVSAIPLTLLLIMLPEIANSGFDELLNELATKGSAVLYFLYAAFILIMSLIRKTKLSEFRRIYDDNPHNDKELKIILGIIIILSVFGIENVVINSLKLNASKNNLITSTSIAGVEFIGKTLNEIMPNLDNTLIWEHSKFGSGYYDVKNGKTTIFSIGIRNGIINSVSIYDPSLVTKDGLHVGSTSGDILRVYPNATVYPLLDEKDGYEGVEYVKINGITYLFDDPWGEVGNYPDDNSMVSKIVNKEAYIERIFIGNGL
jgi:zinc transporter ZupT